MRGTTWSMPPCRRGATRPRSGSWTRRRALRRGNPPARPPTPTRSPPTPRGSRRRAAPGTEPATPRVRRATAAADIEDVTQKHPVTPGAVLPARELLGDLLLELNRPADAARAYEAALRQAPGRARSLFGLARAAEQAGDITTARARYREFLDLMAKADGDRPELAVARKAIASR